MSDCKSSPYWKRLFFCTQSAPKPADVSTLRSVPTRIIAYTGRSTVGTDHDTQMYWSDHEQSVHSLPTVMGYKPHPVLGPATFFTFASSSNTSLIPHPTTVRLNSSCVLVGASTALQSFGYYHVGRRGNLSFPPATLVRRSPKKFSN